MVSAFRINAPSAAPAPELWLRRLRRFFRSPKGFLLVALLLLAVIAAPQEGIRNAALTLAAAVAGAAAMELALVRLGQGVWRFPSSALLSGLIVALVLSAQEPPPIAFAAGLIATDAKHLLRLGRSHVFNPAAVGLLLVYVLFGSGQSWWGALADLPAPLIAVLAVSGYIVADRANKLPAALSFAAVYVALFTVASYAGNPALVADIFRSPFSNAVLFFALFMVSDPPTSPVTFTDQVWFGALVAAASYLLYMQTHALYYLLIGVLIGNAAWAVVRELRRSARTPAQPSP
jgi:Na+-translocating ferredoxin:NAD+ oxidoreductase RnfD subunit